MPVLPDPFATVTVNGGQNTYTTSVVKKTLKPYWNESFDLCVLLCDFTLELALTALQTSHWRKYRHSPGVLLAGVEEETLRRRKFTRRESYRSR